MTVTSQPAQGFHTTASASRPRLTVGAALGLTVAIATLLAVLWGSL